MSDQVRIYEQWGGKRPKAVKFKMTNISEISEYTNGLWR